MYSVWTKHLDNDEDKARFLSAVESAKPVLDVLSALIYQKKYDLERNEKSLKVYDNPNWANRQAHLNGYDSALDAILNLINSRPKSTN